MQNSNIILASTWENLYGSHAMASTRTSLKGLARVTSRQGFINIYVHRFSVKDYCFTEKDGEKVHENKKSYYFKELLFLPFFKQNGHVFLSYMFCS